MDIRIQPSTLMMLWTMLVILAPVSCLYLSEFCLLFLLAQVWSSTFRLSEARQGLAAAGHSNFALFAGSNLCLFRKVVLLSPLIIVPSLLLQVVGTPERAQLWLLWTFLIPLPFVFGLFFLSLVDIHGSLF
jgi:hypothetical protein